MATRKLYMLLNKYKYNMYPSISFLMDASDYIAEPESKKNNVSITYIYTFILVASIPRNDEMSINIIIQ